MSFSAPTLFQLVVLITWTCLDDTPFYQKNTLFARFITSQEVLGSIASTASLVFCPGLFEVLQAATPPDLAFFKSLPTATSKHWGIYVILLEKPGFWPKIYIGSSTNVPGGVTYRLKQHDDEILLPLWVEDALDHGYAIVHKGLLCWIPIPTAALVPVSRLLFLALEATFSYIFWGMKAKLGDYGMGHICLWDRDTMEYGGLCSHPCLNEGIQGDFELC